jgi:hypothetical protein
MSEHADTPPSKPFFPNWILSVVGVAGSIAVIIAVLGVAYYSSHPTEAVDADIVADRVKKLADVRAAQADLYYNYSWVDQTKQVVRIPVDVAMGLEAARLDAATRDKPEPPARLSLAASPAGFTPPAPPATVTVAPPPSPPAAK